MEQLIDGLLEFGRLSRQPLRLQRVRPADIAREVIEEQGVEREGRRVELRIGEMPECRADPVLLKQVYANLVSNALKYTRGRPEARIEVGAITMGLGPVYYVRDNGAGFDMALSRKLFGMFERLHATQEFEGTGVGLALVQRIVERHGGKVWADSAPERGATFFFRIEDEAPAGREGVRAVA
jgi:light-regulated signal transduction histidine kinase (bacteriophytochrome)